VPAFIAPPFSYSLVLDRARALAHTQRESGGRLEPLGEGRVMALPFASARRDQLPGHQDLDWQRRTPKACAIAGGYTDASN